MNNIVSYRVRLARNLKGVPFPDNMDEKSKSELIKKLGEVFTQAGAGGSFTVLWLNDTNRIEARSLVEKHRISPEFAEKETPHAVVLSSDNTISVMLCEEDHLRIQVFGDDLSQAYKTAYKLEILTDEHFPFAFSEKLGFLTSCPTNLGTGLRASALMHLPGLTETQSIRRLIQQATSTGLAFRGFYGEGTQAAWGYYQISNSVTLGLSEQEIIGSLTDITKQINQAENMAMEKIRKNDAVGFEDRAYRAYGLLTNARRISTNEAMEHLSVLRMGGIPGIEKNVVDSLSEDIWPAALTMAYNLPNDDYVRDEKRADRPRVFAHRHARPRWPR